MNEAAKPLRVLVTGASGTVGWALLQQAAQLSNYQFTAFDLPDKKVKRKLTSLNRSISVVYGDITDKQQLDTVVRNKDVVIHLAAVIPPLADDQPELAEAVNVAGTQYLVEAMEEYAPGAHLLYSSSISVYGDRLQNPDIRVKDPLMASAGDEYAVTKIAAETIVKHSRLNWTIFRLTAIMGVNNHKISGLMFHMPLNTPMEIASPEDTARAFLKALDRLPELNHHVYNLGGGHPCRILYREFLNRTFRLSGLGAADFPEHAFATCNFHCGNYADGDELEAILHFRQDSIEDHFNKLRRSVSPVRYIVSSILSQPIKNYLLRKSEPYQAFVNNDKVLKNRFFG
jgi:nucleoside-diphosphate-sugar epimerase